MGQECFSTVVRVVFRITLKRRELSLQSSVPPEWQSKKFFLRTRFYVKAAFNEGTLN